MKRRRAAWDGVTVAELRARSDGELRAAMKKSAMQHTKVAGLQRNLAVSGPRIGPGV